MAHPIYFWNKPFFYALGNTPAVNLVKEIPPEEAAHVLLLGCGDPRNILFTVFSCNKDGHSRLDFTCCDIDVAVLSRNVLLLTLLADKKEEEELQKIWNVFYHLYLDQSSLELLVERCRRLYGLSESIDKWNDGPYGGFLRLCTKDTLQQLRRHWLLYADAPSLPGPEKKSAASCFKAGVNSVYRKHEKVEVTTASRNAGPLWSEALPIAPKQMRHYWEHGSTATDPKVLAAEGLPNPTFAYSLRGQEFAVHYGTNPMLGFHLATAFADLKPPTKYKSKGIEAFVSAAKEEFFGWAEAFRERVGENGEVRQLVIRVFVGEALGFCKTLAAYAERGRTSIGAYVAPWRLAPLVLDGGDYEEGSEPKAPSKFNSIDSSNLVDHLGILNVLLGVAPLISQTPCSTLYTETLVASNDDPIEGFIDNMCADLPLMALLFNLVPVSYLSGFAMESSAHDVLALQLVRDPGETSQFHQRIAWKIPAFCDVKAISAASALKQPFVVDTNSLSSCLFAIYHNMFSNENINRLFSKITWQTITKSSLLYYTRESFAIFLRMVKDRVSTDWESVMNGILDKIMSDQQLILGMNSYQEFTTHCYNHGVHVVPVLQDGHPTKEMNYENKASSRFKDWTDVPSIVCCTLVIPRKSLKPLMDTELDKAGTPILQCEYLYLTGHNIFSSFHPAFATAQSERPGEVTLVEDPKGWNGSAPLTASFWVPAALFMIVKDASQAEFKLAVRGTPQNSGVLHPKLGADMCLFKTKLSDTENVLLSKLRPNTLAQPREDALASFRKGTVMANPRKYKLNPASLSLDASSWTKVSMLGVRVDIVDPVWKEALANGATVSVSESSPCTVNIKTSGVDVTVLFPYPVSQARHKLRIARKSSYIEVLVPTTNLTNLEGSASCRFPVVCHNSVPITWNLHYLNFSRLPRLDISSPKKLSWVQNSLPWAFSSRERDLVNTKPENESEATRRVLTDVKLSYQNILCHVANLGREKTSVFILRCGNEHYAAIFVTDVFLDLGAHTCVLDCCIMWGAGTVKKATTIAGSAVIVNTDAKEKDAWRQLFPAITERCRTWKHREGCSYLTVNRKSDTEPPLCACAPGNPSEEFLKTTYGKKGLGKYVTRAALAPLYYVPWLEPMFDRETREMMGIGAKEEEERGTQCEKCGKSGGDLKLKACARCKVTKYCSRDCQKDDWKVHKKICGKL